MAKLIKGSNVQNIIMDSDIIMTSESKIGKTLDQVLVEQQFDIDKLKSNIKYIYAYGGVGGSGSGGSGTGEKPVSILITLNGTSVSNETIILDGRGKYKLYIKLSNAGGKNYFIGYSINSPVTDKMMYYSINGDNKYRREIDVNLNVNGDINIRIDDDEGNTIGYYTQKYIVDSDIFNVSINYRNLNGEEKSYSSPYECHVGDPNRLNRFFKIDYSIFLTNYTDVYITCEIDGKEGINNPIYEDKGSGKNVVLPMEGKECVVFVGDKELLHNDNMGLYTLRATLSYVVEGRKIVRTKTIPFSIVPSGLYISVRTLGNVLYDSVESLKADCGANGKPKKYITAGSSLMLYSKVFEGTMDGDPTTYPTFFNAFDAASEDDSGNIIWNDMKIDAMDTLIEQKESKNGVSITFPNHGIKKITITTKSMKGDTGGSTFTFEKFVYVDEFTPNCDWYNGDMHNIVADSYFRANQGDKTYLNFFPKLPSNKNVLSLTISSDPIELSHWDTDIPGIVCTTITLGIQVSNINPEDAKIIDIYPVGSSLPKFTLRTSRLFSGDANDNKIAIPTEILNKNDNSQYHLVQIIRTANIMKSGDGVEYEDSLYIDGLIESVDRNVSSSNLVVEKIILNNINICYNLINVQYFESSHDNIKFNPDAYAYQYWLSYKEKYVNSSLDKRLTEEEYNMKNNIIHNISFDGTNVEVDKSIVLEIAKYSSLPSVIFSYDVKNGDGKYNDISSFMEMMWAGRTAGDTSFGNRAIDLYWIPPHSSNTLLDAYKVMLPQNFTDNSQGHALKGNWEIGLQGTSTMRNRIKNYSLRINSGGSGNDKILFSPNFDIKNPKTFLPDVEWTIKADIADSAHANNTSIGKFVNDVCTKFDTKIPRLSSEAKPFIKNTLSGIPILLYFRCKEGEDKEKIYYFGIYNFNLGRSSYYNLGYTGGLGNDGMSDFMRVFNNIKNANDETKFFKGDIFTFAVGEVLLSDSLVIGEIQDNYPQFDFHQCQESILFKQSENDNVATMFGADSKIVAKDKTEAKKCLLSLVEGVAKAGKYCFMRAGREDDMITSMVDSNIDDSGKIAYGGNCINRYEQCKIPDTIWQMKYENDKVIWIKDDDLSKNVNEVSLKKLITRFIDENGSPNKPLLNYTSASEYYTICMAFGMVDSVLKNMNLKNFEDINNPHFYCAFYDMDCALEEDNSGVESVSYLAATDYWESPLDTKTNKVGTIVKKNDYWDRIKGGQGFDFTSSYLLAVIKYAKPIFDSFPNEEDRHSGDLNNYPQRFWASLRSKGGALENADIFIENYFKSGILSTFEYLASLNYRVKYLYNGSTLTSDNQVIVKPLANAAAFNGSRRIKVKNWLSKRLRFMDVMMNVNGLSTPISDNVTIRVPIPGSDYTNGLTSNPDITILHSAFDVDEQNKALNSYSGEVEIYAPKNTPFIFSTPSRSEIYLLPGGIDNPNKLYLQVYASINTRFFGSGLFTSVDKIETMFTEHRSIISDNIEKITYGKTNVGNNNNGLTINAKSAIEINLDIPNMGGELRIDDNCISLRKINIANSGFYGSFNNFPNLQDVNISGVKGAGKSIYVSNSDFLTGERFIISGSDEEHKTTLNRLEISGVTGNFYCENTNIEYITIQNNTAISNKNYDSSKLSEFSISNDASLTNLTLIGFKKVSITSCNCLETLIIDDSLEELYINLEKLEDETTSSLKKIFFNKKDNTDGTDDSDGSDGSDVTDNGDGIFDFTNYKNLKKVKLMNCDHLEHVKLPDRDIETYGMSNNPKLKWIDTGSLPAFRDDREYYGGKGTKYEGKTFLKYGDAPKLILCSDSAFYNCPNYSMLRSDWNTGKTIAYFDKEGTKKAFEEAKNYKAYTNIIVSNKCKSLSNTFGLSKPSSKVEYKDEKDDIFRMDEAIRFIVNCVPDEVKKQIESLSGCFKGRTNIEYKITEANKEKQGTKKYHPTLTKYESLNDISLMYENTNVTFVTRDLLDLPSKKNKRNNELNWGYFINGMTRMSVSNDALYNISYRLSTYSYMNFTIYEYDEGKKSYELAGGTKDNPKYFKICDFFYPFNKIDEEIGENVGTKDYTKDIVFENIVPYENIKIFESLNFGNQYIDFKGMFELFPNVETLSTFLNGDLSKYKIQGLLKPCKNIKSIIYCFNDSSINDSKEEIDLYEFFNWEGNTEDILHLFESLRINNGESVSVSLLNGFVVKKTITYENFKKVLQKITEYSKLTRLTNLFSYCTITGYHGEEIKFTDDNVKLNNITNISNLFENCTSDYMPFENTDKYEGGLLNIGRSFFKHFPKFTVAQRTLANTHLSSPLTYDYFCKRDEFPTETKILLSENIENDATLFEYEYSSNKKTPIINLKECFYNTKFVNCKNWFDPDDSVYIFNNDSDGDSDSDINIDRNYIKKKDGSKISEIGSVYYTYNDMTGAFEKHTLDNDAIDDCLYNYTDFVPKNTLGANGEVWYNHNLKQDLYYYGNVKDGKQPFDIENGACNNTIQKTYCCLPPDFLYGCSSTAIIDGIFANTNIIGVIPRNLTKKVKSKPISNIFRNVNIMPNLEYYYDENNSNSLDKYILNDEDIVADKGEIEDNCKVVYRDEYGILRKRKPVTGDRSLGQFVYVPANFTNGESLLNAFNFRYNLPKYWAMPSKQEGHDEYYKSTKEFNEAINAGKLKLPYHSQYYFLTDKCVEWKNIYDARSVFIKTDEDIDFRIGQKRKYYDGNEEVDENNKYAWTFNNNVSASLNSVIERFYIDLNLCGKKNENNMIEDYGCPVDIKDRNRTVRLDEFVSGILTIFLNGRVFYNEFVVNDLTTSNHKSIGSSAVIEYYGFGKNIILPSATGSPLDEEFVFIPVDDGTIYYDFMVDNNEQTMNYYNKYFAKDKLSGDKKLFIVKNKYTLM